MPYASSHTLNSAHKQPFRAAKRAKTKTKDNQGKEFMTFRTQAKDQGWRECGKCHFEWHSG